MCGFVGIINASKSSKFLDEKNLNEMRDSISHRGPDDADSFIDAHVGLGFRRLAILDLSEKGRQPMHYKDLVIVFNGEIFNYLEIKDELLKKGHQFTSLTDTEVILHSYEEWGKNCVKKFNGMFAFAIYDRNNKTVLIFRDRLGVKPLYYTETNKGVLVFASEIKAICKYNHYKPSINKSSVYDFFRYTYVPGEQTLFENVNEILPGYFLEYKIEESEIEIKKYWDLPDYISSDSFETALDKIDYLLSDSVKLRLISDVPVGIQLSGGLDSSLVAQYASKHSPHIYAISINVDDSSFSEKRYSQFVAEKFRLEYHPITLDSESFFEDFDRLLYIYDEPLPHSNSIGIYLLSRYAKETVTVLLSGEGADELFCGYSRYSQIQNYHNIAKIPVKKIREKLAEKAMPGCFYNYLTGLQKRPLDNFYIENVYNSFRVSDLQNLFNQSLIKNSNEYIDYSITRYNNFDYLNRASRFDIKNYLVALLQRQDRMSMAFGIENRVPFLDYRLVEYVSTLPSKYKVKNGITKYILKELGSKHFPKDFLHRAKQGFGIPLKSFLKSKKGIDVINSIIDNEFVSQDIIDINKAKLLFKDFLNGKDVNMGLLWSILTFEKWARIYF